VAARFSPSRMHGILMLCKWCHQGGLNYTSRTFETFGFASARSAPSVHLMAKLPFRRRD